MKVFRPGDLCEIVGHPTCVGAYNPAGLQCTVLSDERRFEDKSSFVIGYEVRVPNGDTFAVRPEYLRKIDPPSNYDGNQLGEWDLVPWRPAKERVT